MGTFLYYARDLYCTIMSALNSISEQQEDPTQNTKAVIKTFFDYAATNSNNVVKFRASDMVLQINSDALHLSGPWSIS